MPTHPAPATAAGSSVHAPFGLRFIRNVVRSLSIAAAATVATLASAADIPRPWGLDYTPSYVPTYDPATNIPADALDRSAYGSTAAWLADCLAQNKPGKIASGTYDIAGTDLKKYAPKSLYGYGATKPVFNYTGTIAETTPGFLYLGKYTTFKVRYLEFRNFGDVFDLAVGSVDRGTGLFAHQSSDSYAFCRYAPQGEVTPGTAEPDGVGLPSDTTLFPRVTSTIGPAVDISYCKFKDCQRAYGAGSDTVAHGRMDFHKNVLEGTYGGVDINFTSMTEVYAANNEWFGLGPAYSRTAPTCNSNGFHTLFRLGVESGVDINLRTQKVYLENNYAHDIEDQNTSQDANAAVFSDVRHVTPTTFTNTGNPAIASCDISISFNAVINVRNTRGHEDANAFYGKIRGGVIERNYVKNAGAADARPTYADGSEGTGMVFKEPASMASAPASSFIAIRGNVFEDMPANTNTPSALSVVKLDKFATTPLHIIGNQFWNCHNTATTGQNGLVRHYNTVGKVTVWGNQLYNCNLATRFLNFHEFSSTATGHEVSNNIAHHGTSVNYTGDLTLIRFGSTPSGLVTGLNVLDGSSADYAMLSTPAGSSTSTVRTYTPPMIPVSQVAAPSFSPGAGTYATAQSVTITTGTSGATIRYTTNGTTPTSTTGTVYSSPVSISATSTLKAIAYKSGMADSTVTSGTYTITGGGGSGAFQMSSNEVVMEAEHFTSKVTASGVTWTAITDAAASGGASNNAMQALPNTGASSAAPGASVARMDYQINVPSGSATNFYVHLRTRAATTTDDSVWVSIDGGTTTYQQMGALTTGYSWRTSGSSFAIPTGLHTITIWMREDGMIVDKIVVKNSSTAPTGTGPAESPQL
ncbi:MAG: chitobiase/beta-hexosaminidase C-terminal domain-containing protein [Verrucomicrobiota bacterium]